MRDKEGRVRRDEKLMRVVVDVVIIVVVVVLRCRCGNFQSDS